MSYQVISGTVSHANRGSGLSHIPVGGSSISVQKQIYSFRLDGRQVTFLTEQFPSVADGDTVMVVGHMQNGGFRAVALRNLTSGAESYPPTGMWSGIGWVMAAMGVLYYIIDLACRWPYFRTPSAVCMIWIGIGAWIATRNSGLRGAYRALKKARIG